MTFGETGLATELLLVCCVGVMFGDTRLATELLLVCGVGVTFGETFSYRSVTGVWCWFDVW